jgi:gas vesicle protein
MIMKEEVKNEPPVEMNNGSILVPFLVGGVVGAGIALLLAPKSGKELRGDIKGLAASTKNSVVTAIDGTKKLYDESRTAVKTAIDAGTAAYVEERDKHRQAA